MPKSRSDKVSWKRVSAWIAGVTAILTLAFGLQRVAGSISDWRAKREQVRELLAAAEEQRVSLHYAEALATLADAAKLRPDDDEIRTTQENLAMEWLRAARVRVGEQTFTEFVKPLLPIIERGVVRSQGTRKADLIAHVGWVDFLRSREGADDRGVEANYRRAVQLDASNPFAHAMWGHWRLFSASDLASANEHFAAALKSGREREYVRQMQLAGLLNTNGLPADQELLRVSNEMRQAKEPITADVRDDILWQVCISTVRSADSWTGLANRISASDEIATLQWLAAGNTSDPSKADLRRFCEARAYAIAGQKEQALAILHELERNAAGDMTRRQAEIASQRLSAR